MGLVESVVAAFMIPLVTIRGWQLFTHLARG
jgi:hypothetical protein